MNTWYIHIQGQVQGVGFRPFIYSLAKAHGLNGWVNNDVDGVHIAFNGDEETARSFKKNIVKKAPQLARITSIELDHRKQTFFDNFQIIRSERSGKSNVLITPDVAICKDCSKELWQNDNRRKSYPFITCTNCGPRYSIFQQLPYDRATTTMDDFQMCNVCKAEYENPLDRRYYSQTNSCPNCNIELTLLDSNLVEITNDVSAVLNLVIEYWEAGKIVALKGIGGYLLTCDANNEAAISRLRKRKHRPSKPFALMYPNVASLTQFELFSEAIDALNYPTASIVLLDLKEEAVTVHSIAPQLKQIGLMLPYTPLYELLLRQFGKAIVATSGNISNTPIIFEDEKAKKELSRIADFILTNNRKIVVPQDDSVIKFSPFTRQKIVLRRSRGLAPSYINAHLKVADVSILAMGAMLKSTFSLQHQNNIYISQYLGDLQQFDTQQSYQHTLNHFLNLFDARVEKILCDKNKDYSSSRRGEELAEKMNIPIHAIQHHIAHFGAILGEHHLVHSDAPILGVIWDGTGLGDDSQIWGGEFFKYEKYDFLRCAHFDYFDFILGDKMPKEPRISALSACWQITDTEGFLKPKFTSTEWQIYSRLLNKKSNLKTSSVGRIFDAVASLLGVLDQQTYEGEAALQLEALATNYFKKNGLDFSANYFTEATPLHRIPTPSLMAGVIMDLQKGESVDFIAAKFHFSLMKLIDMVANNLKIKKIAFSGGVFQNGLLVDLIRHHLHSRFELYFHEQLSPNDENISFGQLICHEIEDQKHHLQIKKKVSCV